MGRGRTIESIQDMEDYRKDPFLTPSPGATPCRLPNIWSTEPEDLDMTCVLVSQQKFVRRGKVMYHDKPKPYSPLKINPLNSTQP